jgi:hypothetical protein
MSGLAAIKPARDEQKLQPGFSSMAAQTCLPERRIVIEHGSAAIAEILDEAPRCYPWLVPHHLPLIGAVMGMRELATAIREHSEAGLRTNVPIALRSSIEGAHWGKLPDTHFSKGPCQVSSVQTSGMWSIAKRVWLRLPPMVTRRVGAVLYRYLA